MFTGLIEAVGQVSAALKSETGLGVSVHAPFAPELSAGESVAVNGVCLTVARVDESVFQADIGPETLRVTTLAALSTNG